MKKSLIALAVAGALTAPVVAQADATLYGSVRIKVVNNDVNGTDVRDNSSRIGIKASTELFSGAKAIARFEQAISTETGAWAGGRLGYAGVTGSMGTALFGRMWTPYYNFTGAKTDIADNATSASSTYQIGVHRASNVIAYVSPDMSGLQLAAAVIADDTTNGAGDDNETLDGTHVAAHYASNGFSIGASYLDFETNTLGAALAWDNVVSLAASYSVDNLYVATRFEDREAIAGGTDQDAWELAGSYTMGNTTLIANYIDDDANTDESWSIEAQQKLGKQARVFAAVADYGNGNDGIELGYRVDF